MIMTVIMVNIMTLMSQSV